MNLRVVAREIVTARYVGTHRDQLISKPNEQVAETAAAAAASTATTTTPLWQSSSNYKLPFGFISSLHVSHYDKQNKKKKYREKRTNEKAK